MPRVGLTAGSMVYSPSPADSHWTASLPLTPGPSPGGRGEEVAMREMTVTLSATMNEA